MPIDPNLKTYEIPHAVGVTQLAYDLNWETWRSDIPHPNARWTTEELLDDIAAQGINAVKIWFKGDPLDGMGEWCWSPHYWDAEDRGDFSCAFGDYGLEDMWTVWTHPKIEVYTIRFQNASWSIREHNARTLAEPRKMSGTTFANEPTYWLARALLEKLHDIDKVLIFSDWEQDWSIRGQNSRGYDEEGNMRFPWDDAPKWYRTKCIADKSYQECGEMLIADRAVWVLDYIGRRQLGIEAARAEFPRANFRILHSLIINRYPGNFDPTDLGYHLAEMVRTMKHRPDIVGISFWDRYSKLHDALLWLAEVTRYPMERIYVDEFGEWRDQHQARRIWDEGRAAKCLGVRLLNVWMYRETWCATTKSGRPKQHGLFEQLNCPKPEDDPQAPVEFGEERPGLQAVRDLISWTPSEVECEEVFALPTTLGANKRRTIGDDEPSLPPYITESE